MAFPPLVTGTGTCEGASNSPFRGAARNGAGRPFRAVRNTVARRETSLQLNVATSDGVTPANISDQRRLVTVAG
jgi:hypothetical protein